jgi:ABC-type polysaccharide/polyol phosphate transport system ATPase subunit
MNDSVVVAENLSKRYRVYATPWDRLREALTRRIRHRDFHALEQVTFRLERGEGLAVVGENGAGKSTLLKILAGITTPSAGMVEVHGKIASILELGSGFHPEFTGRHNIVLISALLWLTEADVKDKMPFIIDFSELGVFIDLPVKCFSTGMAMLMGFDIATQVDPDVLIIDEALSVGDGYFQKKCMDRLQSFVAAGGTLLFCSHAMYYVSAFCRRALWLKGGAVAALGPVDEVVREYENYLVAKSAKGTAEAGDQGSAPRLASRARPVTEPPAARPVRIAAVRVDGVEVGPGRPPRRVRHGAELTVEVDWECRDPGLAFHAGIGVNRADGVEVCAFSTIDDGMTPLTAETYHRVTLTLPGQPMVKGEFMLYVYVLDERGLHVFDQRVVGEAFTVESGSYRFGLVSAEHRWSLGRPAAAAPAALGVAGVEAR